MTLFNFGAIRWASGNAIHISPEVIEFGTVGIGRFARYGRESYGKWSIAANNNLNKTHSVLPTTKYEK